MRAPTTASRPLSRAADRPSVRRLAVLATFAALAFVAAPADAASLTIGQISNIDIAPGDDTETFNTSSAAALATPHLVTSIRTAYGSKSDGWTEASAGLMRMFAYSNVVDPLANGYGASSSVVAQQSNTATLTETLQVLSTTLALNTPVDLLFNLSFAQTVTSSQALSLYLRGNYTAAFTAFDLAGDGLQLSTTTLVTGVLHTFVGQTVSLSESMFGGTYAEFIDQTARNVQADATHSAHFYIDAQTPGVTLLAESGHDYSSAVIAPVPEPSSLALLCGGLLFVGWSKRARKEAQRRTMKG